MATLARNRPQGNQDFEPPHEKVPSAVKHYAVNEAPEPPATRLDVRDALVKRKGGGFAAPKAEWFDNSDENGKFRSRSYNGGLTFVMGFQCTWLELEKIENFITKDLFSPTGRVRSDGIPERALHLEDARLTRT
jgi:hypothetical protein